MDKKKILERLQTPKAVRWFWIVLCAPVALILLLLLLTRLGAFGKLPTFEELENPKSNLATEIYSDDGEMIGSFFIQNRSYVDYNELSPALVAALISTEDMRFYSHSGIDFISLARVAVKTLALGNRRQGGGSTITQQLAKNLYPRDTAVYNNPISKGSKLVISKLKEWITAVMLEYNYTKEEIITMYLNTVPYGSLRDQVRCEDFFQQVAFGAERAGGGDARGRRQCADAVQPAQQSRPGARKAQHGHQPHEGERLSDPRAARLDSGAAHRAGLPPDFPQRGYGNLFPRNAAHGDDFRQAVARELRTGRGRRLGLSSGRRAVGKQPALRLVRQEREGQRTALRPVPRRTEDLYDGQCDDAAICRASRLGTDGGNRAAYDGPGYEGAGLRFLGYQQGRARSDHEAREKELGPLPTDEARRSYRRRDR